MVGVRGQWAVVTGASSGLGADFARALAARGMNVILVARRKDRLLALAEELKQSHRIAVDVIALDLSETQAAQTLHAETRKLGREVLVLINNAGFGVYGSALDLELARIREMISVDVLCLTELACLYGRDMRERGAGYILNVASVAGTHPAPTFASYGAAKSYVLNFSYALREELRGTGVSCTALAPGVTATEFFSVSGSKETLYIRLFKMPSVRVIEAGLKGMFARRALVIPGLLNRLQVWGASLAPKALIARLVAMALTPRARVALPSAEKPRLPGG